MSHNRVSDDVTVSASGLTRKDCNIIIELDYMEKDNKKLRINILLSLIHAVSAVS